MKTESTGRPRRGLPAWVVAASVGVALIAASAIVVRWAGGPSPRFVRDASSEGGVSAVAGAVEDEPAPSAVAVEAASARPTAILASLPFRQRRAPASDPAAGSGPRARPPLIERARAEMAACRERYKATRDYSCVFHKRERIDGKMVEPHVMTMRVRTEPYGIYFKFISPDAGREAIFQPAKHSGKIVYHDVGLGRLVAGTLLLDPKGTLAMEDNRHPITDAGIGNLIETLQARWEAELRPGESLVEIHPHAKVGDRSCLLIETIHPRPDPAFIFHKVKVYIDREHGLPIRFEAYDWPRAPGAEPELVEEYTYAELKTDVGVTDLDFDAANPRYNFGRF